MVIMVAGAGAAAAAGATVAPLVSADGTGYTNSAREDISDPVVCGLRFSSDTNEYRCTNNGSFTLNQGVWLDAGVSSDVWVVFNRTAGATNWTTKTSGTRYNIVTSQTFALERNTPGTLTITGSFAFYDAATGGNLLDTTTASQVWTATQTVDPCPICCFTPDTPVTMASGVKMPIGKVREGDMIMTMRGAEPISEVITRRNRVMYRITFVDGTYLNASEDHPFDVKGEPKSVNPIIEYKDVGMPGNLVAGDAVTKQDGTSLKIKDITQISYPGTVYTLGNTLFYAKGMLVY